jgi:hypothetical protein
MAEVRALRPDEMPAWDRLVEETADGWVFARTEYLRCFDRFEVIGAFDSEGLAGGFAVPVIEEENGVRAYARPSFLSPYFAPLFRAVDGRRVRAAGVRAELLQALLAHMQATSASIMLPLAPRVEDMRPFQRAHFALELRYTYELALDSLERVWDGMEGSIRNHVRRAEALTIVPDPELTRFAFPAALWYEPEDHRPGWEGLVRGLVRAGRGMALLALHEERPVGGLFVAFDRGTSYGLLSYFDRSVGRRGIPAGLLWAAIRQAAERGAARFDFEGSVLPGVERFFEAFGGERRSYFQVHWGRGDVDLAPLFYHYE